MRGVKFIVQALTDSAKRFAAQYPAGAIGDAYVAAAQELRLPYWDWLIETVDDSTLTDPNRPLRPHFLYDPLVGPPTMCAHAYVCKYGLIRHCMPSAPERTQSKCCSRIFRLGTCTELVALTFCTEHGMLLDKTPVKMTTLASRASALRYTCSCCKQRC